MPTAGSLYFHIPFCTKKCPYCHFFVLPNEERFKKPFLPALLKEVSLRSPELQDIQIVSIYFGGGTPTKLPPEDYATLLNALSSLDIAPDCEITIEANPEDVTPALMSQLRALGINRVSIGVQSLIDEDLHLLGRTHPATRAEQAIHDTYNAGITNISIDLMFELPGQTLRRWEKCLQRISSLPISHLSLYNLTFEPHTVFFKQRDKLLPKLPPDEERLQMLQMALTALESYGLKRYEISAFAKPGMHSRHNTGYWTARPFLGFGPSAFSYWDGARFSNASHFNKYLTSLEQNQLPTDFTEKLEPESALRELLAVRLRLTEGVNLQQFGTLPSSLEKQLEMLQEKGWLERVDATIRLTASGQLFYDTVASELI